LLLSISQTMLNGEGRREEAGCVRWSRVGRGNLAIALRMQTINMAEIAMISVRLTTVSTTLSLEGGVFEFKESFVSLPV
jgi:hypothetical protein